MADSDQIIEKTKKVELYEDQIICVDTKTSTHLVIDRNSGIIKKVEGIQTTSAAILQSIPVHGIYGIIDLVASKYLILITKAFFVGQIMSKKLFRIVNVDFIPIFNPDKGKKPKKSYLNTYFPKDSQYLQMLRSVFKLDHFYYSYEYDLTSPLPKVVEKNFAMRDFTDEYFWNQSLLLDIMSLGVDNWILPIISGFIEESHGLVRNIEYDFILMTRRSKHRTGKRFVSRGLDYQGNSSNFAETEQILIINELGEARLFSFLQTRGSVPLVWEQKPSLKWEPKPFIKLDREENVTVAQRHFEKMNKNYGNVVLINLIDRKKFQKVVGEEYTFVVQRQNNPQLRLIWFDFHQECRKNKYENLSKLVDHIGAGFLDMGYSEFNIQKNKGFQTQTSKVQKGVFRINCMDSLDRTNVVQSVLARNVLHQIFYDCGMPDNQTGVNNCVKKFEGQLEDQFRSAWTNNANAVSILYTGTPAMKTDFTRTGKRTFKGNLADGKYAITRYVINNFYDGYNQNCVDLSLAKLKPKETPYVRPSVNGFFIAFFMVLIAPILAYVGNDLLLQQVTFRGDDVPVWKSIALSAIFYVLTIFFFLSSISGNPNFFIEKPVIPH